MFRKLYGIAPSPKTAGILLNFKCYAICCVSAVTRYLLEDHSYYEQLVPSYVRYYY